MSKSASAVAQPVAPDSVHVWRGYRAPAKTYEDFAGFLGKVFVPACSLLQPNAGLRAYVPSMPSQNGKPSTVPDQTALMFWASQQAYADAFNTVAVRAYTNLHGGGYAVPPSSAQFPIPLAQQVVAEQPYHLFDNPADWMLGTVRHLVGGRPEAQTAEEFLAAIQTWATRYRQLKPEGVDAALLCAGNDYVAFWEHWSEGQPVSTSPLDELSQVVTPYLNKVAEPVAPGGLWEDWAGFDLIKEDCINVQLQRPAPPDPTEYHS
jgi:hypothetical protein